MPANLTPQYHKVEQEYRRAATVEEELRCLQLMLAEIPKHKGTDKLQAELKAKISKAKKDAQVEQSAGKKKGPSFRIPRQGAGMAVILGGPNAGKSQLLASLTRATPEVAVYPFTTQIPQPGMMPYEDVFVQLIDTPPVTADYIEPYTLNLIRGADQVLLMVDLGSDDGIERLQDVLDRLGRTKSRLGRSSYLDEEDIGLSYTRTFVLANKIDLPDARDRLDMLHELIPLDLPEFAISAHAKIGLEEVRKAVFDALDVIRVYSKLPSAKEPDMERPFTCRRGATLIELAQQVHKDFVENFKFARVWGEAVHPGTQVKGDYVLHNKDIVELHAM